MLHAGLLVAGRSFGAALGSGRTNRRVYRRAADLHSRCYDVAHPPRPPMSRILRLMRVAPRAAVVVASILGASGVVHAASSDDVRKLVESGQATDAYAQCAIIDVDADPRADLWCGVAAVDVGRAGVGVLALERYNLRYPDDVRARLELARAYFFAQDDLNSRLAFEAIAKL